MLTLKNICFSYDIGSPYVLKDINLTVNDGDYISIVGENGSGKSTLVKVLLGLQTPSEVRLSMILNGYHMCRSVLSR